MSNKGSNKGSTREPAPKRVVLASDNAGKLAEFKALLGEWHCEVVPQSAFGTPECAETGDSFVENALLKAHAAAHHCRLPAIADDSGLEVDVLDGAPGIFSARYAGPAASDTDNNHKLLAELAGLGVAQRSARFHCALVYLRHWQDPNPIICQANWEGVILEQAVGENGFGYDPLFYVPEQGCSSAQLPSATKNRISHRGRALRQLLAALRQEYS
ncbi:MAG: RdgB/HAM1 family non-canonical purine NTP pyrophosphatase [Gammaproteobacteria bacterium]|nr:RdgB/HAM1 family non-canonical purine NTP pyrophosphatase [Gammaproteobacteria bacterium]